MGDAGGGLGGDATVRGHATLGVTVLHRRSHGLPGTHVLSVNKDETYTIEGVNADLRTYLGRLKRRSRCFSRSVEKLNEAVRLFVWHYNRRRRVINDQPHLRHALPLLF